MAGHFLNCIIFKSADTMHIKNADISVDHYVCTLLGIIPARSPQTFRFRMDRSALGQPRL